MLIIIANRCDHVAKEEAEGLWSLAQALHPQEVQRAVGVRESIIGQGDEEARESTAMAKDQVAQCGQI